MHAIILGVRRQGKSTLALFLARSKARGLVIFDPNNQFRSVFAVDSIEGLQFALEDGEINEVRYLPNPDDVETSFGDFAFCVWSTLQGVYSLIIDEADEIQRPTRMHPMLARFVRRAPTEADFPNTVHIFQCTHRASDLNSVSKALATDWYIFRSSLKRDVDVITEQWGEEIGVAVQSLPKHAYLHAWLAEGGERQYEIVTDSASWYVDITSKEGVSNGNKR